MRSFGWPCWLTAGILLSASPLQPAPSAVPITAEPHHHLVFANARVRIFDVVVGPGQSTLPHRHDYDYFFVVLGNSLVSVRTSDQTTHPLSLPDGAVRFTPGGFTHTLTNDSTHPFHNITVELLDPRITAGACSCAQPVVATLCGCPDAPPLGPSWQARLGHLELASVVLEPAETYVVSRAAGTRFLIALSPLAIRDTVSSRSRPTLIRLPAGHFHWLAPGTHQIENVSDHPVRFLGVSF